MSSHFTDVSIQGPGPHKTFSYRSGLAVFEETLFNGVLVASGYNGAGYPLNVLSNCPSRFNPQEWDEPYAFSFEVNGIELNREWECVGLEKTETENGLHVVLTLRSGLAPVILREHTLLDGTQMMSRWFEIENASDSPMNLGRMMLHGGGLEAFDVFDCNQTEGYNPRNIYDIGYFNSDEAVHEGEFAWHPLRGEVASVGSRFGRNRFRHPALFIRNKLLGSMFFMQAGWSGGVTFSVDLNCQDNRGGVKLRYSADITGYKPLTVIAPGETLRTPEYHFGLVMGDLDCAVNEMIAHIRKSVLCRPEADGSACVVGAGMGPEHDMSVTTTKSFMKQMKDMGAELFIIDAGWYCPPGKEAGNWYGLNGLNRLDKDRYPDGGLEQLRDYCHSLGMKFGMWVEIERIGWESGVGKKHPEWFAKNLFGDRPECGLLDLTCPEAYAWAFSELDRMIGEFKLDLLRVDYNIDIRDAFRFGRLQEGGAEECLSLRHFEAVYRLYGELKAKYTGVIFENCASGGGRTDLGQLRAFNHTWVSDNQRSPRSVEITNGMTMVLPPERVDRLFAGMGCHSTGTLALHMRNTMLTHMSLNVTAPVGTVISPDVMGFVRHSVEVYKRFIRPYLPESMVYHHTPTREDVSRAGFTALEVSSPDREKSAIGVFASPAAGNGIVRPKGIRADRTYKVTLDNTGETYTASGRELREQGVRVSLPAALASELILIEAE